jgi:serine/threonine protein kinase
MLGRTLAGRYRVLRRLQQGGMGAIYIASQEPLGREVALKVLKEAFAADATAIGRFEKEARAVSRLAHPHIVTIYDFGQTEDGQLFLAMELLRGKSLRELLDVHKRVDWRRSLRIVRGVVMGLVEAHRGGIMHRDLKPENVMLVEQAGDPEFVKLLDFGLARSVQADADESQLTQRNMIPGTPNYISPERVNGIANDLRSDLYSLGAMWFELLTGRIPFEADTSIKIIVRHLQDPPPRPSEHGADPALPKAVDDLVLRLLQKSPDARPASAQTLLAELNHLEGTGPWAVASATQIGDSATQTPELGGWASEASVDFDFSPITSTTLTSLAALEEEAAAATDEPEPIALTRRKGEAHTAPAPSDTSDAAVVLLTRVKSPAKVERKPLHSIAEVATKLAETKAVDEVARLTVDFLRGRFTRVAGLDMREKPMRLLDSFGTAPKAEVEAALQEAPRLHDTVAGGEAYYGPPKAGEDWSTMHRRISGGLPVGGLPGGVLLAALRRNKRPALLLYADHDAATLLTDLSEPARLLKEIAAALTMLRF